MNYNSPKAKALPHQEKRRKKCFAVKLTLAKTAISNDLNEALFPLLKHSYRSIFLFYHLFLSLLSIDKLKTLNSKRPPIDRGLRKTRIPRRVHTLVDASFGRLLANRLANSRRGF